MEERGFESEEKEIKKVRVSRGGKGGGGLGGWGERLRRTLIFLTKNFENLKYNYARRNLRINS